jgi:hypothetical protein
MELTASDALAGLPSGLRDDLLNAFGEIVSNYRERRWEPSELNGGKLCEAVFTVVDGYLAGDKYPPRATKPSRFPQACLALEQKYAGVPESRSPRVLIPRVLIGLYDIRNNRGVGHAGADVDPNPMDAMFVLHASKWLVAELVRLLHALSTDEASEIVDVLVERELPWVWTDGDKKRLLRLGLTWKQQTLVMLLTETGEVAEDDLRGWLDHPSATNFRKNVLRALHKVRQVEYDSDRRTVRLLPPGVAAAEVLVGQSS